MWKWCLHNQTFITKHIVQTLINQWIACVVCGGGGHGLGRVLGSAMDGALGASLASALALLLASL